MTTTRFAAWTGALTAGLAFAGLQCTVYADHIDGHDDGDAVFPMPFPGQEFFDGGVLFVTMIGPVEGTPIFNTTFDITWESDGATPASDLHITMEAQINDDFVEFVVNGSDLGFGEGPGTFTGTLETDVFNGVVWQFDGWPHSLVDLQVGSINGGINGTGFFVDSFINFHIEPPSADGDLNGDGVVDTNDLIELLGQWGKCKSCESCSADLDDDCNVSATDLIILLGNWG